MAPKPRNPICFGKDGPSGRPSVLLRKVPVGPQNYRCFFAEAPRMMKGRRCPTRCPSKRRVHSLHVRGVFFPPPPPPKKNVGDPPPPPPARPPFWASAVGT